MKATLKNHSVEEPIDSDSTNKENCNRIMYHVNIARMMNEERAHIASF
jgi:hypothetical protein